MVVAPGLSIDPAARARVPGVRHCEERDRAMRMWLRLPATRIVLVRAPYRRLIPEDLIDIVVRHRLHFDPTTQQGVVLNLIGALSEFGKLGRVCSAGTTDAARALFAHAPTVLDQEAGAVCARGPLLGGVHRQRRFEVLLLHGLRPGARRFAVDLMPQRQPRAAVCVGRRPAAADPDQRAHRRYAALVQSCKA